VRREDEALPIAQLVEDELARGGDAVVRGHSPASRSISSAMRIPRSDVSS
jgi:hypothetical protein